MEKEAIRKQVIKALQQFTPEEKKKIEHNFYLSLFSSDFWKRSQIVGVTLSKGFEWDTAPIIEQAWKDGKKVCVPKSIHDSRELHFYQIERLDQVEEGYFGLSEPIPEKTDRIDKNNIELLIVPGVVFTEKGYRIGFGGGYYDRFLADYANPTVSIIHSNQLINEIPIEPHDVAVNYLITENGLFSTAAK